MSGRWALLITDIVDSTGLTERLGDAAAARLWAAHDRIARDLLAGFHGREIDKTDGLLLLFADAADAVRFSAAYLRALAGLEVALQARAGLHVGRVILRENSSADVRRGAKPLEVEGIAKATAARIMSIAGPGQTLLSADAKKALEGAGLHIVSHGHWRLKGLSEPLEVFEASADAGAAFTPLVDQPKAYRVVREGELWLPQREIRHSLSAERDAFIDRLESVDELARQVGAGARLVCVTGIGGTGKTRLVNRFAWSWLGEFPGGAWFCDLSQARNVEGICRAVGQSLDVPLANENPVVQLGNAIAARGVCLVILDNFEQVSSHAEATLGQWLDRARLACFVVTSRNVLGVAGERVLPLAPLRAPDASVLFAQRAQAAKRDFAPSAEDRAAIGPLVRLLEGLPLAIELAAARVRLMPPRTILARMSERFKVLSATGGRHERQATLRATFDWSWDLLTAAEKTALAQLSVFEGGFDLAAAEALLDFALVEDPPWALDALQSLLEKSLVRQSGEERFDLLGSVQEYAADQLRSAGRYPGSGPDAALAAELRHSRYFAGLSEQQATARRCVELDNLVIACRRSIALGNADVATRVLEGAWAALQLRGPFQVGVELASQVRSMPGQPPELRMRAERIAGRALQALGRVGEARQRYDVALALARQAGDRGCEGRLHSDLAVLDGNEARMDEARAHLDAALAIARVTADRRLECEALNVLGTLDDYVGRIADARRAYDAALALARETGDRRWQGGVLGNLGNLDASQGRWVEARAHYDAGLALARELGNRTWEGNALCNLGLVHQQLQEIPQALEKLEASLQVAGELGHARLEAIVLCNLGIAHEAAGQRGEARVRYEAALGVSRTLDDRRSQGQVLGYLGALHAREGRFVDARRHLEEGEGLLRASADPVSLAILLCGRAESEWLAGSPAEAASALVDARAIAAAEAVVAGSELAVALERVGALLRAAAPV